MGTLEAKSIITETETPLEEPAGAKRQEEESGTQAPRKLCDLKIRGSRSQQSPPEKGRHHRTLGRHQRVPERRAE